MLVTNVPIKRFLPHEPSEWIEFRRPSWKELKLSRKAKDAEDRDEMKGMPPELLTAILSGNRQDEDKVVEALRRRQYDPDQFDPEILLVATIVDWSAVDDEGNAIVPDLEQIRLLDEPTKDWAMVTAIEIGKPPTEEEGKAA